MATTRLVFASFCLSVRLSLKCIGHRWKKDGRTGASFCFTRVGTRKERSGRLTTNTKKNEKEKGEEDDDEEQQSRKEEEWAGRRKKTTDTRDLVHCSLCSRGSNGWMNGEMGCECGCRCTGWNILFYVHTYVRTWS
ncbi:hypothetical protein IWZ03DRAFT_390187 [Phyllosticta citriasiana]|uniref:Secreted protein n=1 Tax=Phyllosticta citriasiana TaxID=595635 RepID=A0ABR1KAW3_9PEZI